MEGVSDGPGWYNESILRSVFYRSLRPRTKDWRRTAIRFSSASVEHHVDKVVSSIRLRRASLIRAHISPTTRALVNTCEQSFAQRCAALSAGRLVFLSRFFDLMKRHERPLANDAYLPTRWCIPRAMEPLQAAWLAQHLTFRCRWFLKPLRMYISVAPRARNLITVSLRLLKDRQDKHGGMWK